jgi:hypothetical protein
VLLRRAHALERGRPPDHREALRIGFRNEQKTPEGVRRELIGMLSEARS